jgi:integrase
MTHSVLPFGTQIALAVRDSSESCANQVQSPKTLGDLLHILGENPPAEFPTLRTTCARLSDYLDKLIDQITMDSVNETRDGFRPYLESRRYAQNTIRTYVNHTRLLLKRATEFGWEPSQAEQEEWRCVLALARERKCADLAKYLAGIRETPRDVTIEDVDGWVEICIQRRLSQEYSENKRTWFWRLLRDCGCTEQTPLCLLREKGYGIPLEQFPDLIKREVIELLRWKCAEYSAKRPKGGRHRKVTSINLQYLIQALYGFVVNILGESDITTLPQLVEERIIDAYIEWGINARKMKGVGLVNDLRMLSAAMRQHPAYKSIDFTWFPSLVNSIPVEDKSELKRRKARKYLAYEVLESIPAKVRAERPAATKKGISEVALLAMQELTMKWFTLLPWRQLNLRECRIGGPKPNLFKGPVSPYSGIDKPEWVEAEERKNPAAPFWQFEFSVDETKTGIEVRALLPRPLIGILEEYLNDFRRHLLHGSDPGTLLLNHEGNPMVASQMRRLVSVLTLRHGGRRVTPHLVRDIFAYAWLKAHPGDYLTLSKMFWHSTPALVIATYGSRFDESSAGVAMEAWAEEREANSK